MSGNSNRLTTFCQIIKYLQKQIFDRAVEKHKGDAHSKGVSCFDILVAMIYGQMSGCTSLRELEVGLEEHRESLAQIGAKPLKRSSLSYANAHRDCQIFEDYYKWLYEILSKMLGRKGMPPALRELHSKFVSLDSTTITLSLDVFNWAKYKTSKGGIKVHAMYSNETGTVEFAKITNACVADIKKAGDLIDLEADTLVLMDRGYTSYNFWEAIAEQNSFFVTRLRRKLVHTELPEDVVEEKEGKYKAFKTRFTSSYAKNIFGDEREFLIVRWKEDEKSEPVEFITNDLSLQAEQVATLYRERWQIETFFKALKQNLIVKSFLGTSKNAVKIQIWTAMTAFLLLTFLNHLSERNEGFSVFASLLRSALLSKNDLYYWLKLRKPPSEVVDSRQLMLFFCGQGGAQPG